MCVTCTGAPIAILDQDDLEPPWRTVAQGRPLLVVDVAVPRNVLAAAEDISGLTLLDIDDVQAGSSRPTSTTGAARPTGPASCSTSSSSTTSPSRPPERSPRSCWRMRQQAEAVRRAELDRVAGRLAGLDERQREAVEALTKAIVAKLLHEPTVRLKDAAGTPGASAWPRPSASSSICDAWSHNLLLSPWWCGFRTLGATEPRVSMKLRIATRRSPLARWQAEHVAGLVHGGRLLASRPSTSWSRPTGDRRADVPTLEHGWQGRVREGGRGRRAVGSGRPCRPLGQGSSVDRDPTASSSLPFPSAATGAT